MVNTYNRELRNGRNDESVTVYRSNGEHSYNDKNHNLYNRDLETHTVKEYEVQCKNTMARDFTFGLTAGLALGTLAGLLLAPKPGRDLKNDINSKVISLKDNAANSADKDSNEPSKTDEIKNKVTEKVSEVKDKALEIKEQVVQKVGEVKEQAAQKAGEVKEQAAPKVEAAKEQAAQKADEVKEKAVQKADETKEKAQAKKEEVKQKAEEKKEEKKNESAQPHSNIKVVEVDDRDIDNTDVKTNNQSKNKAADQDALAAQRRAIKAEVNDETLSEPLAVVDKDTDSNINNYKENNVSGNVNKKGQNNNNKNNNSNKNGNTNHNNRKGKNK